MGDSEFLDLIDRTLASIENAIEQSGADVEPSRAGNVLTLEFDDGTKIIVNSQVAMHELWVAARSGGFHFRYDGSSWRDTRAGTELYGALSSLLSLQTGAPITLRP